MVGVTNSRSGQALRRYPALAWLGGAVALALLLPSGLNVPNSGPSSLAEYAPVPGQGTGDSPLAELGDARGGDSGGFGGGAGNGSAAAAAPGDGASAPGRIVRKPGTKRCVGDPPRQTEDPLSPPCVAYFEGDNGGATWKGVTADEAVVVVEPQHVASERDPARVVDCDEAPAPDDDYRDLICKAYARFFNERYQTYDRRIRLHSARDARDERWADVEERYQPFASVRLGENTRAASTGTLSASFLGNGAGYYRRHPPFAVSFRSELEEQMRLTANMICLQLADGTARHAGDVAMRSRPRVFGLWSSSASYRADELARQLQAQCDLAPAVKIAQYQDATGVARMQQEGVTTVIVEGFGEAGIATVTTQATRANWFPEWFVVGSAEQRGLDTNFYGRFAAPAQWANAFGITFDYRRDAPTEQPWYRAYREGCPQCPAITGDQGYPAAATYDALTMLFYGIQAAGPRLTPQNWDKGMHAIPPSGSSDPYKPAAYFAPGNYTFLKDAAAIWWDTTGRPPGSTGTGCYRLVADGQRRRLNEWPAGDSTVKAPGPCQGDLTPGT